MVLAMARPTRDSRGMFQYRRPVPLHLRALMGKDEWKRSLSTRDEPVALRRVVPFIEECAQAFALAQGMYEGSVRLDAVDVQQFAARWFHGELARLERSGDYSHWLVKSWESDIDPSGGEPIGQTFDTYQSVVDPVSAADIACHTDIVIQEILTAHKLPPVTIGTALHSQLSAAFWLHLCDLSSLCLARMNAGARYVPLPVIAPVAPLSFERAAVEKREGRTVMDVWEAYKTDRAAGKGAATATTLNDYRGIVQAFVELFGDIGLSSFTNELAQEYRLMLARTPVSKGKGIRGLTAREQIALAEANDLPKIEAGTIKKRLRAMSSVLSFAKDMGWIKVNPIVDSGVSKRVARDSAKSSPSSRKRKEYTRAEMTAIFTSPVYASDWRPKVTDLGEALHWMPLLAAYTGARQNELAQLFVRDVRTSPDGIAYLSILNDVEDDEGDGRRVKTLSSRRDVPLHSDLLQLGFMAYVESLQTSGQLFPKLTQDAGGKFGTSFGRHWGPYLKEVARVDSPAAPMHGFRHTFKTLCRGAGIPDDVHESMTGHSGGTVGRTYGSMPLERKAEELKKFPSIARMAGILAG